MGRGGAKDRAGRAPLEPRAARGRAAMAAGAGALVPASPNWFVAQCCDAARGAELAAYAARNSVVVAALGGAPVVSRVLQGHTNRVTAVCFVDGAGDDALLLSASLDSTARLWDSRAGACVRALRVHQRDGATAVCCVAGRTIVTGSSSGQVLAWPHMGGTQEAEPACAARRGTSVTVLRALNGTALAAVGYDDGHVCVLDAERRVALCTVQKAHSADIQGLDWYQPSPLLRVSGCAQSERAADSAEASACSSDRGGGDSIAYLATSARDRRVCVWAVPIANDVSRTAVVPTKIAERSLPPAQKGTAAAQRSRTWVPVCWLPPSQPATTDADLSSSSISSNISSVAGDAVGDGSVGPLAMGMPDLVTADSAGELMIWRGVELRGGGGSSDGDKWTKAPSFAKLATAHTRPVFSIALKVAQRLEDTSSGLPACRLFTVSMDRTAALWDLPAGGGSGGSLARKTWQTVGLGGFGYCLGASPADRQMLAAGVGDNTIRLLRIPEGGQAASRDGARALASASLAWRGIGGKVTALAWHPTAAGVLAYATDDGSVSLYDASAQMSADFAGGKHAGAIRSLCWIDVAGSGKPLLCSCGGGKVYVWAVTESGSEGALRPRGSGKPRSLLAEGAGAIEASTAAFRTAPSGGKHMVALGSADGTLEVHTLGGGVSRISPETNRDNGAPLPSWGGAVCMDWANDERPCLAVGFTSGGILIVRGGSTDERPNRMSATDADSGEGTSAFGSERVWLKACNKPKSKGKKGKGAHAQAFDYAHVPVPCVAWSPSDPSLLAAGLADGAAAVWRISTAAPEPGDHTGTDAGVETSRSLSAQCLARMEGHSARVQAVCWCLLSPGALFTTSEDQTIQAWDVGSAEAAAAAERANADAEARKLEAAARRERDAKRREVKEREANAFAAAEASAEAAAAVAPDRAGVTVAAASTASESSTEQSLPVSRAAASGISRVHTSSGAVPARDHIESNGNTAMSPVSLNAENAVLGSNLSAGASKPVGKSRTRGGVGGAISGAIADVVRSLFPNLDVSGAGKAAARAACVRLVRAQVRHGVLPSQVDDRHAGDLMPISACDHTEALMSLVESDAAERGAMVSSAVVEVGCGALLNVSSALSMCLAHEARHMADADIAATATAGSKSASAVASAAHRAALLALWRGDVAAMESHLSAARSGLTADFVAAGAALADGGASDASRSLYLRLAQDLSVRGDVQKAVLMLLAAGESLRACEELLSGSLFLDAAVLAVLRLAPDDSRAVLLKCADKLDARGAYEHAACLLASAGCHGEAAQALSRRCGKAALRAASSVLLAVAPVPTEKLPPAKLFRPILEHATECIRRKLWAETTDTLGAWLLSVRSLPAATRSLCGEVVEDASFLLLHASASRYVSIMWCAEQDPCADWGETAREAEAELAQLRALAGATSSTSTSSGAITLDAETAAVVNERLQPLWDAQFCRTLSDALPHHVIIAGGLLCVALPIMLLELDVADEDATTQVEVERADGSRTFDGGGGDCYSDELVKLAAAEMMFHGAVRSGMAIAEALTVRMSVPDMLRAVGCTVMQRRQGEVAQALEEPQADAGRVTEYTRTEMLAMQTSSATALPADEMAAVEAAARAAGAAGDAATAAHGYSKAALVALRDAPLPEAQAQAVRDAWSAAAGEGCT